MNILSLGRQNSNDLIWLVTDQVVCCRGWLKNHVHMWFFFKSQHKKVLTKIRKKTSIGNLLHFFSMFFLAFKKILPHISCTFFFHFYIVLGIIPCTDQNYLNISKIYFCWVMQQHIHTILKKNMHVKIWF